MKASHPFCGARSPRLTYASAPVDRLTHYLFRFPAKFHPPIARTLLEKFTNPGDIVLDPFCGSGTLLVEAMVLGRNSIGVDIDPVATFITRVKTHRLQLNVLRRSTSLLFEALDRLARPNSEYEHRKFEDITHDTLRRATNRYDLTIPPIPNIEHWFRRYVIVDLARIRRIINSLPIPASHRVFFLACFAAIIRNASNADPVPVSGLEVTVHMKRRDAAGRIVNPFQLLKEKILRALNDLAQFCECCKTSTSVRVIQGDAARLGTLLRTPVDGVITSPPYHNAVDYYRRHTLEMYWLDFVANAAERLRLRDHYIGQSRVRLHHPFLKEQLPASRLVMRWQTLLKEHSISRAAAFTHYCVGMCKTLAAIAILLPPGKPAVFVLGRSGWNGNQIPTVELFEELAGKHFQVAEHYWYPLKNRYMTYSRHNDASIDKEYVLVLRRT